MYSPGSFLARSLCAGCVPDLLKTVFSYLTLSPWVLDPIVVSLLHYPLNFPCITLTLI